MTEPTSYNIADLVERYSRRIYGLALRLTQNEADAEDVLQETFLTVMQKLDTFEGRSDIYTWIHRIGTNIALGKLRRLKATPDVDIAPEDFDRLTGGLHKEWNTDDPFGGESPEFVRDAVNRAAKELPESLRAVFMLRDVEDLSTRETAEILGITQANVKVRLMRARIALRNSLAHLIETSAGIA